MVQDIHFILLDTEMNMPGTKSVFLQSLGKTTVWPWIRLSNGQNPLSSENSFCNKSHGEGSTGDKGYTLWLLFLQQNLINTDELRIIEMPCDKQA